MTTHQKRVAWLGVLLTILGAVSAPLLGAAWHSKVSTSDYRVDMQRIENNHTRDVQRLEARDSAVFTLLLDMRCDQKPSDRRCKP